jgi:hypothetical protein
MKKMLQYNIDLISPSQAVLEKPDPKASQSYAIIMRDGLTTGSSSERLRFVACSNSPAVV